MIIIFWILLSLIFYCYLGYPLLIGLAAKCSRRQRKRGNYEPSVSIVLSVWNEEDVIKKNEGLIKVEGIIRAGQFSDSEERQYTLIQDDESAYSLRGARAVLDDFINYRVKIEGTIKDESDEQKSLPIINISKIQLFL